MDLSVSVVARETSQGLGPVFGLNGLPRPMPPKTIKKPKKAVLFFEVEILDAKTREKLCFLDKVGPWCRLCWPEGAGPATHPFLGSWPPGRWECPSTWVLTPSPCPSGCAGGVLSLGLPQPACPSG